MLRIRLFLITALVGFAAQMGQAQVNLEAQDPEGAFLAFFRAFAQQRWDDAAALLDLTALDQYRRQLVTSATSSPPAWQPTVEDLLRQDPEMPRAVAEYQLERATRARAARDYLSFEFEGVRGVAQLDTMPLAELAVRWLRAQHPATRLKEQLLEMGCRIPPDFGSEIAGPGVVVVGTVEQRDGTAFVLFADTSFSRPDAGFHAQSPQVAQLKRIPSGWRVLARYDLIHPVNTFVHVETCPERYSSGFAPRSGRRPRE